MPSTADSLDGNEDGDEKYTWKRHYSHSKARAKPGTKGIQASHLGTIYLNYVPKSFLLISNTRF